MSDRTYKELTEAEIRAIPTSEGRRPGEGLTEAEKVLVAADEAEWKRIEQTPEFREMVSRLEERIALLRTGEVGRLSVDREDTQRREQAAERQRQQQQERGR